LTSEANNKAKDLTYEAKPKDLTSNTKANGLTSKAKTNDLISEAKAKAKDILRGQGQRLDL